MQSDRQSAKAANIDYLHYNNGYEPCHITNYGGLIFSLKEIIEYLDFQDQK